MFSIVKSISIIFLVSALITAVCYSFFSTDLVGTFTLTTIIQISLGWFINTINDSMEKRLVISEQGKLLAQIEAETVEAPCAYCGEMNLIPVSPTQDNDFECISCGERNAVYVNITVAQKAVQFDAQPFEVTNYSENLQHAKDKLLNA